MDAVFARVIEPELERIPVLEVVHSETHDGRAYQVHQMVSRNVFPDFDLKLSRHLAATSGRGFPAFRTDIEVRETNPGGRRREIASAAHGSVPHALLDIARRAVQRRGTVDLIFKHNLTSDDGNAPAGLGRKVGKDELDMLDAALRICRTLGETEFLQISGDFDILIVTPPGNLAPLTMHLGKGTLTIPGNAGTPFECPIITYAKSAAGDGAAQHYLARVRHALVGEKEAAIAAFRATAEARILATNEALGTHAIAGHRLQAVEGLVDRLTAGLGPSLKGLAEDARITALDWRSASRETVPAIDDAAA